MPKQMNSAAEGLETIGTGLLGLSGSLADLETLRANRDKAQYNKDYLTLQKQQHGYTILKDTVEQLDKFTGKDRTYQLDKLWPRIEMAGKLTGFDVDRAALEQEGGPSYVNKIFSIISNPDNIKAVASGSTRWENLIQANPEATQAFSFLASNGDGRQSISALTSFLDNSQKFQQTTIANDRLAKAREAYKKQTGVMPEVAAMGNETGVPLTETVTGNKLVPKATQGIDPQDLIVKGVTSPGTAVSAPVRNPQTGELEPMEIIPKPSGRGGTGDAQFKQKLAVAKEGMSVLRELVSSLDSSGESKLQGPLAGKVGRLGVGLGLGGPKLTSTSQALTEISTLVARAISPGALSDYEQKTFAKHLTPRLDVSKKTRDAMLNTMDKLLASADSAGQGKQLDMEELATKLGFGAEYKKDLILLEKRARIAETKGDTTSNDYIQWQRVLEARKVRAGNASPGSAAPSVFDDLLPKE